MKIYSKDELIIKLKEIRDMGWIQNARHGNAGGIGNTLEDLLGIEENNLPIPNAAEWELKCQRANTSSYVTLFHMEPSPRAIKFVPAVLLPNYGWPHQLAGIKYPKSEMSFRQTINGLTRTDRGFGIFVDRESNKIVVSFDVDDVNERHSEWLESVKQKAGLEELKPQPYWGFHDLYCKAGTKLLNCFFITAKTKRRDRKEYYLYDDIKILQKFSLRKFIDSIKNGYTVIDFDARTGHNHGTKFRIKREHLPKLYGNVNII